MIGIIVSTIAILIFFNALYVAGEFGTVSSRHPRVAQLAEDGNRLAQMLLPIIEERHRLDTYVAACQIGITLTSLTLGYYGQASLTPIVGDALARLGNVPEAAIQSLVATGILLFLTALQVILGELVPKNIGIQYPEQLAMLAVGPVRWSMALFRPLIWLFNGSGQLVLRLMGLTPEAEYTHVHAPDEIVMLVEESSAAGLLDREERRLLTNTLRLRELTVRQAMIPRTQMLAAPAELSCEELLTMLATSRYSRMPLFEGTVDNIIGVVHLKDLLCLRRQGGQQDVRHAMHTPPFIPETLPVQEALALLQREHYHVAIVLDEFGGTEGMVTLEDLIEEIFGEFQDEFDVEPPQIRLLSNRRALVRGDTLITDLAERLNVNLPSEEVDTVGGLVLSELGHVPEVGDKVQIEDVILRVEAMDGKAITAVSLLVSPEQVAQFRETVE